MIIMAIFLILSVVFVILTVWYLNDKKKNVNKNIKQNTKSEKSIKSSKKTQKELTDILQFKIKDNIICLGNRYSCVIRLGNIDYNIHAKTTEFGYFGWNIDISCFYALNRNTVDVCGNECIDKKAEKRYEIHAVDLSNPFPSPDGGVLTDPSTTGSSAGFNCTDHANNVIKDPQYTSQPGRYFKWVQRTAYDVYSPKYVDYRVYLTKQKIKRLRASKHKYTDFDGEYVVDSVVNYKSPLFRNGGLLSDSQHPNDEALKCNNMVNWQSSECQTFDDVGEE